jgi:hypothetical protein
MLAAHTQSSIAKTLRKKYPDADLASIESAGAALKRARR